MTSSPTTYPVAAELRSITGKQVKQLRNEGKLPAVVYGHKKDSVSICVPAHEFAKTYHKAGSSSLMDLSIDGKKAEKVLVQEAQTDPVTGRLVHIDFYLVNMKEKLQTEIPLVFVGESAAVENDGGSFISVKSELNVECLPQDLIHEIEVDISVLATFDDVIRIGDIKVPAGIEVLDDAEEVVASVAEPRSEEEMAELDEEVKEDVSAVESETSSGTDNTEPAEAETSK